MAAMPSNSSLSSDFFNCIQCGECCKGFGGTYVSDADLAAIAEYLKLSVTDIRNSYCVLSGGKPLLAQRPDGYCVFWDQICSIHQVKPRMCRNWPFIHGLLIDPSNWQIMADSCPGMKPEVDEIALCAYVNQTLGFMALR